MAHLMQGGEQEFLPSLSFPPSSRSRVFGAWYKYVSFSSFADLKGLPLLPLLAEQLNLEGLVTGLVTICVSVLRQYAMP